MWLATKFAAGKEPEYVGPHIRQKQLGPGATLEDGILYNRLLERHPGVARRHDEDIASHFERLKSAEDRYQQARVIPDVARRDKAREEGRLRTPVFEEKPNQPWVGQLPANSTAPDLGGMPQRIPGWYTGDGLRDSNGELLNPPPPGYGTPPMSRRDPGATYRSPVSPDARPRRQTYDEWVQGLAQKGIYLNPDGTRMSPEQMAAPLPRRPLRTGPDIWHQFVDAPSYSGRQMVAAFIKMAIDDKAHQTMLDNDWRFRGHYPGQSGSYYYKTIGDRTHVIAKDDGWIHNSGPAGEVDEYGDPVVDEETPQGFTNLGDAVLHAEQGKTYAGFSSKTSPVPDSSYQPDRGERTEPWPMMSPGGPAPMGKYQTLSRTWEEQ